MLSSISIPELLKILDKVTIVDIRSVENYNSNHIPSAIHIPMEKLLLDPKAYFKKDQVYYLYCQKGTKSLRLGQVLAKQGYKVVSIIGGYEEWILQK